MFHCENPSGEFPSIISPLSVWVPIAFCWCGRCCRHCLYVALLSNQVVSTTPHQWLSSVEMFVAPYVPDGGLPRAINLLTCASSADGWRSIVELSWTMERAQEQVPRSEILNSRYQSMDRRRLWRVHQVIILPLPHSDGGASRIKCVE